MLALMGVDRTDFALLRGEDNKRGCNFFEWLHEVDERKKIIRHLLRKVDELKMKDKLLIRF